MFKNGILGMLAITALTTSLQVEASHQAHDLYVIPSVGALYLDSNRPDIARHRAIYNVGLGYNFTETLGMDVTPGVFKTKSISTREYFEGFSLAANMLYHLNTSKAFVPYATAGVGVFNMDSVRNSNRTDFTANMGIGFKMYFGHHWMFRTDLRRTVYSTNGRDRNDSILNVGIGWHFAGAHANLASNAQMEEEGALRLALSQEEPAATLVVQFSPKKAKFDEESFDEPLSQVATYLKRHPRTKLILNGFDDLKNDDLKNDEAKQDENPTLAKLRAKAVADVLEKKYGVKEEQLAYKVGDRQESDESDTLDVSRRVISQFEDLEFADNSDDSVEYDDETVQRG